MARARLTDRRKADRSRPSRLPGTQTPGSETESIPTRKLALLLVPTTLTAAILAVVPTLSQAQNAQRTGPSASKATRLVKACGVIAPLGEAMKVDIDEGRLPTTCRQARHIVQTYISNIGGGTTDVDGCCSKKVRLGAKVWDCYKSRADGEGWDYHCSRLLNRSGPFNKNFVDVGAGRRF